MTIKPLFTNILIKQEEEKEEKVTDSGIIIPDQGDREPPDQGVVEFIGDDVSHVSLGDTVVFKRYSPDQIKIGEDTYLVISEKDILAVVK